MLARRFGPPRRCPCDAHGLKLSILTDRRLTLCPPALKGKTQDVSALLSKFKMAQERHVQARREAFRKKSLHSEASTTTAEK